MMCEQISALCRQLFVITCVLLICLQTVSCIGCFVCSSVNGSNTDCEDTFNNTANYYQPHCMSGRSERTGMFPATACVKLKASIESEGYSVLIRACVVDNGGINSETEIGRISHCWFVRKIKYMERYMYGCSVACDTDGCNNAIGHRPSIWMVTWATIMALCCVAKQWIIL